MFFKSLINKFRCFFCKEICDIKYRIGERRYYPGYGYGSLDCPKDIKKALPYSGMTVKEFRELMRKNLKEEENKKS